MQNYAAIFRNAPDPIILVDTEGKIIEANQKAHQVLGYSDGEMAGHTVEILLPDRLAAAHHRHRDEFIAHPRTRPMGTGREFSARRKDGTEIPVDIMLSDVNEKEGRFIIAILRDRTQAIESESKLKDLQAKLRLSSEAAGMGYWTYDEAADEFWCDEIYASLLGGKPEEFRKAAAIGNRIFHQDRKIRSAKILDSLAEEGYYESEFRIVRPDGTLRWIGELGRRTTPVGAPQRKFAGVSFDISARKAAQASAELARRRELDLWDLAPDGIFLANLDGAFTDVNVAGCRLLGREREEIIGKNIVEFLHPEEIVRLAELKEKLLHGESITSEWRLRHRDGKYIPVEVSTRIFPDGRWQGFVRDIRDRKSAERRSFELIEDLRRSLRENHILMGMLPICSHCKRIRDEAGLWEPIEEYIHDRSEAVFSHGICPACFQQFYSEFMPSSS